MSPSEFAIRRAAESLRFISSAVVMLTACHQAAMAQTTPRGEDDRTISIPRSSQDSAAGAGIEGRVLPCCNGQVRVTNQAALEQYRKFAGTIKPPLESSDPAENAELQRILKSRGWFKTFSRIKCTFGAGPGDLVMRSQEVLSKRTSGTILNNDATALYGDTTLVHYDGLVNYYPGLTPTPVTQELSEAKSKFDFTRTTAAPERFVVVRITPLSREGYFRLEVGQIGGMFSKNSEIEIQATMVGKMTDAGLEIGSRYRGWAVCRPVASEPPSEPSPR